jgi:imidazoleglycerol-phosphate dehydratase/histidinol-phosphatase
MQKILFIDRDGTIIREPDDEQIDSLEKLEFLPGAISQLARLRAQTNFRFVMITNQDGLGTDSFPEDTFWPAHNKMMSTLEGEKVDFDEIHIDRSFPHENKPTRKPGTAMLTQYMDGNYDLANSFVLGDRASDVELAKNLGCKAIFISNKQHSDAALSSEDWWEIADFLSNQERKATVQRTTSETDITVSINLDGSAQADIDTGLGFFDHMLEQLARHGGIDLEVKVKGDLHIDEHHTIEDTALALGAAFEQALGNKKGVMRYGFLLPMDDCLAQVAIDFGGRPWCVWEAEFTREKIGEMPTEMFFHFFKSFSDTARCNLNIKAEGKNEHHKIEAIFKAWARAIRMAISKTDDNSIPSTKGSL